MLTLEQRTDVPGGIKEHQKEGIRWQALALKWLLDEIQLQPAGSYSTAERK